MTDERQSKESVQAKNERDPERDRFEAAERLFRKAKRKLKTLITKLIKRPSRLTILSSTLPH